MTTLFDPTPYQSVTDLPAMEIDGELYRLASVYVMGASSDDEARSNLNAVGNWLASMFDELAEPAPESQPVETVEWCQSCEILFLHYDGVCMFSDLHGRQQPSPWAVYPSRPSGLVLDFRH